MNTHNIFELIRYCTYIAIFCILALLIINSVIQLFLYYYKSFKKRQKLKINQELQELLTPKRLRFFKRNVILLLECISENKQLVNKQLITKCLQVKARKFANSGNYLKQYFATQCYQYGFRQEDESIIIKLLQSETLLVSLNAATLIYKSPSQQAINTMIEVLAKGRFIHKSLCIEVLKNIKPINGPLLSNYILAKLENLQSKDIYVKVLCYQLLSLLSSGKLSYKIIQNDFSLENVDLKIAIMRYLSTQDSLKPKAINLFTQSLQAENWELRAIGANLLGQIHATSALLSLVKLLHDPTWWVRYTQPML